MNYLDWLTPYVSDEALINEALLELAEEALPAGLYMHLGRPHFYCSVCNALTEWDDDLDWFDEEEHYVCGGSPRCCP